MTANPSERGDAMLPVDDIVRVNVNVSAGSSTDPLKYGTTLYIISMSTGTMQQYGIPDRFGEVFFFSSASNARTVLQELNITEDTHPSLFENIDSYFAIQPKPRRFAFSYYDSLNYTDRETFQQIVKQYGEQFYIYINVGTSTSYQEFIDDYIIADKLKCIQLVSQSSVSIYNIDRWYKRSSQRTMVFAVGQISDVFSLAGVLCGLVAENPNSAIQVCYKPILGAIPIVESNKVETFESLNTNVYVQRSNFEFIEKGTVSSGARFEEVLYVDMIADELQNALLNFITGSLVKLPQTDSTTDLFISECNRILERYYNMGVLATQPWRNAGIGSVANGDIIEHGYICMADSFDTQTDADRAAHKAMPITILLCLSGSVESVEITLYVQQ